MARVRAAQQDPRLMRRIHGWLAVFWFVSGAVATAYAAVTDDTKWLFVLLVFVSFYANTAGHLAGWQEATDEVGRQEKNRNGGT
jgi:hypothetical protein